MGCLTPGRITPMRPVPSHIVRPEYVGKPTANEGNDSNMYTPEEVERVRAAGKIAAGAIVEASKICVPGTTTDEIDVLCLPLRLSARVVLPLACMKFYSQSGKKVRLVYPPLFSA